MESSESEVGRLRLEVERLSRELDQTSAEKVQSAQYGLVLLEEKETLENRCSELKFSFFLLASTSDFVLSLQMHGVGGRVRACKVRAAGHSGRPCQVPDEPTRVNPGWNRARGVTPPRVCSPRVVSEHSGPEHGDRPQADKNGESEAGGGEGPDREGEDKLKPRSSVLDSGMLDFFFQDFNEFLQNKEISAMEFKEIRVELRDFKHRETRLLTDYAELEEENIMLQKQISNLRSSQVEFEGSKHEIRHLTEEVELLNQQVEELTNLKKIAEQQLEEALESLQHEREQRYLLKKELDSRLNSDSLYQLGNLALSIQGAAAGEQEAATENDDESLEKDSEVRPPSSGPPSDLFSEIHGNELKKLEKRLEASEKDKSQLVQALAEERSSLEKTRALVHSFQAALASLAGQIAGLEQIQDGGNEFFGTNLVRLRQCLAEAEKSLSAEPPADGLAKLKSELLFLRRDFVSCEQRASDLTHDVRILEKLSSDALRAIGDTQLEMKAVQNELTKLYEHGCNASGQTPSRIMLMRGGETGNSGNNEESSTTEQLIGKLRLSKGSLLKGLGRVGDAGMVKSNVETVKDQIKYLRDVLDRCLQQQQVALENSRKQQSESSASVDLQAELTDSQENIVKLKSLLSTKREQIATLRTVLKANKQTAEAALAGLKAKYDSEKAVVGETMSKLRNELRLLKEDAATFSSLRAMFAARCEEYATQVEELRRQVASSEEEKKTLNQLLRMAIQQKLVLTQRLEDVEVASEMRNTSGTPKRYNPAAAASRGGGRSGGGGGGGGGSGGSKPFQGGIRGNFQQR